MKTYNLKSTVASIILGTSMCLGGPLSLTAPSFAASISTETAPVLLKRDVILEGKDILLGDLFENAGENALRVVAKAPAPGQQMTLPATWLWRVAKFYKLQWKPTSRSDEAIVTRDSIEMDRSLITETLRDAIFQETGEDELIEIEISNRIPEIQLPSNIDMSVGLKNFKMTSDHSHFSATFVIPASGKTIAKGKLTGKVHMLMEVALPNRRIQAGDIIRQRDLEVVSLRSRKVSRKAIIDLDSIIGMQARRTLTAGRPIQASNLQQPVLVKKNKLVIISLNTMGMLLTVQGKALEDGARKDVIQIKNTQSGTIVEAVVTGPNSVSISAPLQAAEIQ